MSEKCVSMHDTHYRCYSKGCCDGQCAKFQSTLLDLRQDLSTKSSKWFDTHTSSINDSGVNMSFGSYEEMVTDFYKSIE